MVKRHHLNAYVTIALALLLASCAARPSAGAVLPSLNGGQLAAASLPEFKHIFVIVMENKESASCSAARMRLI